MLDRFVSLLAPHSCIFCTRTGPIMCSACAAEQSELREDICIGCGGEPGRSGMCTPCSLVLSYDAARVFCRRSGPIEELINRFKFSRVRDAYRPLAALLIPLLPYGKAYVVVPVPTIRRHVRERGYDHAALMARRVARLNGNHYRELLRRRSTTVQHGTDKRTRFEQVKDSFYIAGQLDSALTYIVVDDIITTGASLSACTRVLKDAGAMTVIVAAVARQPLGDER